VHSSPYISASDYSDQFAADVTSAGLTDYSSVFGGVWRNQSGTDDIGVATSATLADSEAFKADVAQIASTDAASPYVFATVFNDGIKTCDLDVGYDQGYPICTNGDSGGPVYQRLSTGGIEALGVIIGVDPYNDCFFQELGPTLKLVNGTLLSQ
jgi:hypothetical protein